MLRDVRWALALSMVAIASCSGDDEKSVKSSDNAMAEPGAEDASVSDEKVPLDEGDPLSAPEMTWTYVELPGTLCRDGKTTGMGININPASDKLVIYMEGGGACFNDVTCAGNPSSYGESDFGMGPGTPLLARDGMNPMSDWNMVYVPYCSGDVFSGTNMKGYQGQPMIGYINFTKTLERVVPTFKDKVKTVVLSGSSAGGFGTAWNWARTQDAFGDIPVHAFDDSGQPLGPEFLAPCLQQFVGKLWGWKDTIHPACESCDLETGNVVRPLVDAALTRALKGTRFALLSNDEDGVIKTFFAYGLDNCKNAGATGLGALTAVLNGYPQGKFPQGLDQLRERLASFDNAQMFEFKGGGHPVFVSPNIWTTEVGGVTVLDWTKQFLAGDKDWKGVKQ